MRSRIAFLLMLISSLWFLIGLRAFVVQMLPDERLDQLRRKQFETVLSVPGRRGDVFDRKDQELAISVPSHSLFADPKLLKEPNKISRWLSSRFKVPQGELKDTLAQSAEKKRRFVWLRRYLSEKDRSSIEKKRFAGLGFLEEYKRVYPNEQLLAPVLGFVGADGKGLEGLESKFNTMLEADSKKMSFHRDARGRPLIVGGMYFSEAPAGMDIYLTIDRDLQFMLEKELRVGVETHQADSAFGIVLDPESFEVLAMANYPSFNPNDPFEVVGERRRNRSIADSFEPGSIMKPFVIAAGMEHRLINANTLIDCENGKFKIGSRIIREAEAGHNFERLNVSEILIHSSNIGASKIGLMLGADRWRKALVNFGFGQPTGIELPGEAKGILQELPWSNHLLANTAFGQGMSVTALQMAAAYAAIANGGILKRPWILKKLQDPETGEIKEQLHVENLKENPLLGDRRVMSEKVARAVKEMLVRVTEDEEGTGQSAKVSGYCVAGKTGTAQKAGPGGLGYSARAYVSSFVGFVPATHPRFVILIAVDHPRNGYYAAEVAAPLFSRVAEFALRQAGVASESANPVCPKRGNSG